MTGYLVRRLLRAVSTLLGTTLILFILVRVVPADPAVSIAGPSVRVTLRRIEELGPQVVAAARAITQVTGGLVPIPGAQPSHSVRTPSP